MNRLQSPQAREALNLVHALIVIVNRQGKIIFVNDRICKVMGFSRKEMTGENWFARFIPKHVKPSSKAAFKKLMSCPMGASIQVENYIQTKKRRPAADQLDPHTAEK